MKQILCVLFLLYALILPVSASGIVAPPVPEDVEQLMPSEEKDFGNALRNMIQEAFRQTQPAVASGIKMCVHVFATMLLFSILRNLQGNSKAFVELASVLAVSLAMMGSTSSMITMGTETLWQISQYGKLLLPVMTAALASQGGSVTAATLYGATALFDTILCSLIASVLIPALYIFLVFSIISAAVDDDFLRKIRDLVKQAISWSLKIILYTFTGYISISGVISGTADQTAIKAAKLTISGMVPVVGGILSDASEAILVSAALIKNATGIYGLLAIIAVCITPFLTIGINYLLLKISSVLCSVCAPQKVSALMGDFSTAMGIVLGMTGSVCLIQLISVVCFLRGM